MIINFNDREAEIIFHGGQSAKLPADIQTVAFRKLGYIHSAQRLDDLRIPPETDWKRSGEAGQDNIRYGLTTSSACVSCGKRETRTMWKLSITTSQQTRAGRKPPRPERLLERRCI